VEAGQILSKTCHLLPFRAALSVRSLQRLNSRFPVRAGQAGARVAEFSPKPAIYCHSGPHRPYGRFNRWIPDFQCVPAMLEHAWRRFLQNLPSTAIGCHFRAGNRVRPLQPFNS
jgi:hypothetical protein